MRMLLFELRFAHPYVSFFFFFFSGDKKKKN